MLEIMERRLLRGIMAAGRVMTYGFGLSAGGDAGGCRLAAGLDLGEAGAGAAADRVSRDTGALAASISSPGDFTNTSRFYRMINEVPTVVMIAIVLLVVLKPF